MDKMPEFIRVKDVTKYFPFLTVSGVRWLIFRDENFCKKCTRKVGKIILLLPDKMREFLLNNEGECLPSLKGEKIGKWGRKSKISTIPD